MLSQQEPLIMIESEFNPPSLVEASARMKCQTAAVQVSHVRTGTCTVICSDIPGLMSVYISICSGVEESAGVAFLCHNEGVVFINYTLQ